MTIAQHDRGEMTSELQYFDDSGEIATLPATVNSSQDTPYTFRADQIDSDAFTQFPRDKNVSAIDATEWSTTSGASSSMTISQTDGATASGVDSVEFNASVVSGETATATFGNFSVKKDAVDTSNPIAESHSEEVESIFVVDDWIKDHIEYMIDIRIQTVRGIGLLLIIISVFLQSSSVF